jgi:hypothetical protein
MSVAAKIEGRQKDGSYVLVYPEEVVLQNYMLLQVVEKSRNNKGALSNEEIGRIFIFPIPNQLQTQSNMNYEQAELGALGALAAGRLTSEGALSDISGAVASKFAAAKNMFGGGTSAEEVQQAETTLEQTLAAGITGLATAIGGKVGGFLGTAIGGAAAGGSAVRGLGLEQRVAVNPHLAVLFKNVGLRQFGFQYKFVARNRQESDTLKTIIRTLQYHMHPDYFAGSFAFQYPDEFEITFSPNRNEHLFNVKRSVMTGMTVNYNGEGIPIFFEDVGGPVSIEINMTFQETKIHTKRDYAEIYEIERGRVTTGDQTGATLGQRRG